MTYHPDRARPAEAINLADEADFMLGGLRVRPSLRKVGTGAREKSVEPRVMQALIVLAGASGTVVSRDALIDRCWSGRIVGEDAINRCIAKVRALAETSQTPSFTIETISKVGYLLRVASGTAEPSAATAQSAAQLTRSAPGAPEAPSAPAKSVVAGPSGAPGIGNAPFDSPAFRWRAAAIATPVLVLGLALAVVAGRGAAPVDQPPAITGPASFNPPPNSVAVLSFANLSNDPAADYLSEGLSEALIDVLSRADQLRITARTSSLYFKGRAATINQIARTLNVAYVLEGSLRREGTHLRIDAHLGDARTGYELWSRSYDKNQEHLLEMQDEIAADVAGALQVKLVDTDTAGRSLGGTTNPLAFDAYLRGLQHLRVGLRREMNQALTEFRTAVELDPNFALAQGSLARTLVEVNNHSDAYDTMFRNRMAEARRIAERAVQLAPSLGVLHAHLAIVLEFIATDMNAAWVEANRAKALAPGDATVEIEYATIASEVGHYDEAIVASDRAMELDPLRADSWMDRGELLLCARKYNAAIDAFKHTMTLIGHPNDMIYGDWGDVLLLQGKTEAARQICAQGSPGAGTGCLIVANQRLGNSIVSDRFFEKMFSKPNFTLSFNYAGLAALYGRPALAMQWLAKAREIQDPGLARIKCEPDLDSIRNQPGFYDIEKSRHFPPPD